MALLFDIVIGLSLIGLLAGDLTSQEAQADLIKQDLENLGQRG
jgi:hypothetical protein